MFKVAVGKLNISPTAFYSSTPREMELAIEGFREQQEQNFYLTQTAMTNSIGRYFGGKHFKPHDPFSKKVEKKKKVFVSVEQKQAEFNNLLNIFKKEEGEKQT